MRITSPSGNPLLANHAFMAFWVAQTISPLGDRIHQVALAVLVYGLSHSPSLAALVFLASALPQLVLGPIAGVYADRLDRRRLMIFSDLARAVLVLLVPVAAAIHPVATLPLTFLISSVGLFFRPARSAILPAIVAPGELMAANSAANVADTLADLAGYPLAGLITVALASMLWVAFVIDSASYLVSAILLRVLPSDHGARQMDRSVRRELADGLYFLRRDPVMFESTLLGAVTQVSIAVTVSLLVVYSATDLRDGIFPYPASYSALLLASGIGSLLGALAAGTLAAQAPRGLLIVAGYIGTGVVMICLGLTSSTPVALGSLFVGGIFNMLWLVPSQTVFMERVPTAVRGRVFAARAAVGYASMAAAIGLASLLATRMPIESLFFLAGVLTVGATLLAARRPAILRPEFVPLVDSTGPVA